jgi:hypothetical protein
MGFSMGGLLNPFGKSGATKTGSMGLLSPEQSAYLAKLIPSLFGSASGENNAGLESMLGASRASAMSNFQNQTVPSIMAGAGTLHSSYTGNKIGQASNEMQLGLNQNETGMRYQNQQNAIQQLIAALGIGTKENIVDKPGMMQTIMGGLPAVGTGGAANYGSWAS